MPWVRIETSARPADPAAVLRTVSRRVAALLGKDEQWVMVRLESGASMTMGGSAAPCAFVTLAAIGLPTDRSDALVASICEIAAESLEVPAPRVFVRLADLDPALFGWNGTTLA